MCADTLTTITLGKIKRKKSIYIYNLDSYKFFLQLFFSLILVGLLLPLQVVRV
jgi:hypothetical protein